MSHQLRQETQGGVSSGARGIPLEWIAGFLHFPKRLFQMSLSAGLSNKQSEKRASHFPRLSLEVEGGSWPGCLTDEVPALEREKQEDQSSRPFSNI